MDKEVKDLLNKVDPLPNFEDVEIIESSEDLEKHFSGDIHMNSQVIINTSNSLLTQGNVNKENTASRVWQKLTDDFNKSYGLEVHIDFKDFKKSMDSMKTEEGYQTARMYISEGFKRLMLLQYAKLIDAITLLSEYVLDENRLLSDETTLADKFIMIEKLYDYTMKIRMISNAVVVEGSELALENIATSNKRSVKKTDPEVLNWLKSLRPKSDKDDELNSKS